MNNLDRYLKTLNALAGFKPHPRNGKIARLPAATRVQINRMLDDGLPYKTIIAKLTATDHQLSTINLSEMNLSNWVHGGYQDWLQEQHEAEFLRRLPEAARPKAQQFLPAFRPQVFAPKCAQR